MICAWCHPGKQGQPGDGHGVCKRHKKEWMREARMKHGNDPSRVDPPEVKTIQDVRDWYSDPSNIGLPPGCIWVDRMAEVIQLPNREQWRYNSISEDWRQHETE